MLDAWNWVAMATAMAQMMGQPTADQTPAAPKTPRKLADGLTGHLGFPLHKAARVKAVAHWPIGFTRRDLTHWGLLSEEESEAVWGYIAREYGFYTTGTLYAVP